MSGAPYMLVVEEKCPLFWVPGRSNLLSGSSVSSLSGDVKALRPKQNSNGARRLLPSHPSRTFPSFGLPTSFYVAPTFPTPRGPGRVDPWTPSPSRSYPRPQARDPEGSTTHPRTPCSRPNGRTREWTTGRVSTARPLHSIGRTQGEGRGAGPPHPPTHTPRVRPGRPGHPGPRDRQIPPTVGLRWPRRPRPCRHPPFSGAVGA